MIYFRIFFVFLLSFSVVQPLNARTQQIAAVVNEDAISVRDLEKRMRLVVASSGLPNTAEIRQRLMPQVLNGLINEALMLQEASRIGVIIDEKAVDQGFAAIAGQNKLQPDQFASMLKRGGVDVSTLRHQVRAQLAWKEFVQSRLSSRVIVSERDIDDAYERIVSKVGTTEYLTAEIFLPASDQKSVRDARNLAQRLVREIKSGKASFFKLAQQFSKSAGSVNGGDNGWLNESQMNPDLLAGVQKLKKNQVTEPIKTSAGYHILFLREQRKVSEDSLPSRDQIGYMLGSQRLERVQRRHLEDLKSSSFLDIRV